jgi:hypothetical protein
MAILCRAAKNSLRGTPVLLILVQICHRVDDTGGKFPICVVVLVVYLDLRISPSRILKKFEMTLILFLGAWKKRIHECSAPLASPH